MQDELRRKMTKSYYVGIALAAINVIATVVCIFLMPSEVPMSLDGSNVVNRMGSSLENLIWPLVACGTCLVNRVVIKGESKEDAKSIGNATMGIEFLLLVAAGLTYLFLLTYNPAANTAAFVVSPVRLALMASGIALVLLMNTLPVLLIELGSHLGALPKAVGKETRKVLRRRFGLASIFFGWAIVACGISDDVNIMFGAYCVSVVIWVLVCAVGILVATRKKDA